jgi:hypothetical protein
VNEPEEKPKRGWLRTSVSSLAYLCAQVGTHRMLMMIGMVVGLMALGRETFTPQASALGAGVFVAGCVIAGALIRPRP